VEGSVFSVEELAARGTSPTSFADANVCASAPAYEAVSGAKAPTAAIAANYSPPGVFSAAVPAAARAAMAPVAPATLANSVARGVCAVAYRLQNLHQIRAKHYFVLLIALTWLCMAHHTVYGNSIDILSLSAQLPYLGPSLYWSYVFALPFVAIRHVRFGALLADWLRSSLTWVIPLTQALQALYVHCAPLAVRAGTIGLSFSQHAWLVVSQSTYIRSCLVLFGVSFANFDQDVTTQFFYAMVSEFFIGFNFIDVALDVHSTSGASLHWGATNWVVKTTYAVLRVLCEGLDRVDPYIRIQQEWRDRQITLGLIAAFFMIAFSAFAWFATYILPNFVVAVFL
jgi:hypothetical protein